MPTELADEGRLGQVLATFVRRFGVPAVGAAIVSSGARPLIATTGVRVRGGSQTVTNSDRWHIGSCCKSMTAALVARLVERGATDWEAPLPQLLGDLGDSIHPAWDEITLSQLLLHRAGLPANMTRRDLIAAQTDPRPVTEQRRAAAASALARHPRRPGRFRYSNLGYVVAGTAIERLTGMSYEDALGHEILGPLGIASAGFGAPSGPHPWGHRPGPPWKRRGPSVDPSTATGWHPADNPPVMSPAGRLHLDLGDWSRFIALFLEHGDGLLGPGSIARLTRLPQARRATQAMGWAIPTGRAWGSGRIAYGQQGSNRNWVAAALVGVERRHAALVVCNDGRRRLLVESAKLADELLGTYAG